MCQHFLLSRKARTLSLASVCRMSEEEARDTFRKIRWAATDGEPVCPKCGCDFGGDHNQAARFEKLVPAQALKGRFADAVKLDLDALERDFGFAPARRPGRSIGALLARLLGQ